MRRRRHRFRRRGPGRLAWALAGLGRAAGWAALLAAAGLGALGLVGLARAAVGRAIAAPSLAFTRLVAEGAAASRAAAVREAVGLVPGSPLMRADLPAIRARVEALADVASARVARRLPHTLSVHIREHRPRAWLGDGGVQLADGRLVPFKPFAAEDAGLNLPVITGLDDAEGSAEAAVAWLDAAAAAGAPLPVPEEVHHDPEVGWSMVLRGPFAPEPGLVAYLGEVEGEARHRALARVRACLQLLADEGRVATTIWAIGTAPMGRVQVQPLVTP